ncbi:MAG: hypothetical protein GY711_30040, partial [bacterium]|nr:hypothetical protein [bacterium]
MTSGALETESLATDAQHVRPGDNVQARGEAIVVGGGLPDKSDHGRSAEATAFGTGRERAATADDMPHDGIEVRHVKPEQTGAELDMRQILGQGIGVPKEGAEGDQAFKDDRVVATAREHRVDEGRPSVEPGPGRLPGMSDRETHGPQARFESEGLDAPHGDEGAHGRATMSDQADALARTAKGIDSFTAIAQSGDIGRLGEVGDARYGAPIDEREHATLLATSPAPTIDVSDVADLFKDLGEGGSDSPCVSKGDAATQALHSSKRDGHCDGVEARPFEG